MSKNYAAVLLFICGIVWGTRAFATTWYVDSVNGNDSATGDFSHPLKTITQAMVRASSPDTITAMPGTYNVATGETFPITVQSGVHLQSYAGPAQTILDASGTQTALDGKRVLESNSGSAQTSVTGLTITGGRGWGNAAVSGSSGTGGGIYTSGTDQTTFAGNIIRGNSAKGREPSGTGIGGGAYIDSGASTRFYNNVFADNSAEGGFGGFNGARGGLARGGGLASAGTNAEVLHNDFVANRSLGGNGGWTSELGTLTEVSGGPGQYAAIDAGNSTIVINNIVAANINRDGTTDFPPPPVTPGAVFAGGASVSNNLFFANVPGPETTAGAAALIGDPLFTGPDFDIAFASPATGAGTMTDLQTDLAARPRGVPPSIGAFERIATHITSDFTGDGKADILWRNLFPDGGPPNSSWLDNVHWDMDGAAVALRRNFPVVDRHWMVAATGDFNGDLRADLVWYNPASGQIDIWLIDDNLLRGDASTLVHQSYSGFGASWRIVATSDVDHDGKSDIVWRDLATGANLVWIMNGASVTSGRSLPDVDRAWTLAATGDFNGDHSLDFVWLNQAAGLIDIWLMNGVSFQSNRSYATFASPWFIAAAGDTNHDGRDDILWRNTATGVNVIWSMNGTAVTSGSYAPTVDPEWALAGTGLFNADPNIDFVWRNTRTGMIDVWLMDGPVFLSDQAYAPQSQARDDNSTVGAVRDLWSLAVPH